MMSGGLLQMMGTSSRIIRIMIIILVGIIMWRMWYYVFPGPAGSSGPAVSNVDSDNSRQKLENIGIKAFPHQTERMLPMEKLDIGDDRTRVSVYYEALCPDSKDFVVRQLLPTYEEMGDSFVVNLVPYGKATSTVLQNGQKTFQCQHGPKECQANIVHACVDKYIKDEKKSLEAVKCMIEINMGIRDPLVAAKKCLSVGETKVWNSIEQCSSGEEGEELLFMMGKMTHSLNPPPRFIPLITINDSTKNQNLILRNFKKALCLQFSGKGHPACAA